MKRFVAAVTLIFYITSSTVLGAGAADAINPEVIRPVMGKTETLIADENFDRESLDPRWTNMTRIEQNDGNNIGRVAPNTISTYGVGKMWLTDFTLRLNLMMDYAPDSWAEVADIQYKNENSKGKIMLYQKSDKSISRLYFATVGQASNLWYSYDLPADHPAFKGEWFFLKVAVKNDKVNIYLNDESTPVIEAEGMTLTKSALCFKPFATTLYIDNLLITRAKDLPEQTVLPDAEDNYITAFQDFESGAPDSESGFADGFIDNAEDENCFRLNGKVETGRIVGINSMVQFNLLAEYLKEYENFKVRITDNADEYCISFGRGAGGQSLIDIKKFEGSADKSDELTIVRGNGPANVAEADGIWAYFRIERSGNIIKVFFNDKKNPAYTVTDSNPIGRGSISVDASELSSCCIDNFLVTLKIGLKRMFIKSSAPECIEIESAHETAANGVLTVICSDEGKVVSAAEHDLVMNPFIPDGRGFAVTEFIPEVPDGCNVSAYITDKSVLSEPSVSAEVSCNDTLLEINGKISGDVDDCLLIVLLPEDKPELQSAVTANIIPVGDDGSFKFEYSFDYTDTEGGYRAVIYDGKSSIPYSSEFQYISDTNLKIFMEKLNNSLKSQQEFVLLTAEDSSEGYLRRLGTKIKEFSAIASIDYGEVYKIISALTSGKAVTEENAAEFFNEAILVSMLRSASNAGIIKTLFETFNDIAAPEADAMREYETNRNAVETEVFEGLYHDKNNILSAADISNAFTEQVLLSRIYKSGYLDIYQILKEYSDKMGINLSVLPSIESDRNKVMTKLNTVRYYTYEEFKKAFEKAAQTSVSAPRPTGGGGGGGGGGSSLPRTPSVSVIPEPDVREDPAVAAVQTEAFYFDIDLSHWAYKYIYSLTQKGLLGGYEDGSFRPEQNLTRAEFCKLIVSAFNLKAEGKSGFSDVSEDDWYSEYVAAVSMAGYINGVGNGCFMPDDNITRQDIAVIMYRLILDKDILPSGKKCEFADADMISPYAREAVEVMSAGIISGSEGYFNPKNYTTRAEAAKIIYAVLNLYEKGANV
ncbi:MAG: S-layer homology domain-containing protein [Clostridia bacterium]|nr:S-layer homology domain-containing protein [Clostridia bacterium]